MLRTMEPLVCQPWLIPLLAASGGHETIRQAAETLPLPLLTLTIGALFLGTLAISRFSLKIGVPAILGVLLFGLAINTNAALFSHTAIERLHTLSLSMLLFYAGLRTELRSIRGFLEYGLLLALGGVVLSSVLLGLIVWFVASPNAGGIELGFNQIPLAVAMLIASCLGSTDAGATLNVLRSLRHPLPERLRCLLEFESSVNDPAAILFLGMVIGLFSINQTTGSEGILVEQMQLFLQKIGSGLVMGVILGYAARFSLEKLIEADHELLILGVSIALLSYGFSELLDGSGFISAYVTGMFLSNHRYRNARITPTALLNTLLPFNTMTEITVFLIFGLSMHPGRMLASLPEGIVVALGMMLIARPLSVLAFQHFSPFTLRESLLVSWCGLRGAVPLALSFTMVEAIPHLRGVNPADVTSLMQNAEVIVFCVVVVNLLVQGLSLPLLCSWLGIPAVESPAPQPAFRSPGNGSG
jgi:cell volume regulation protein A